MWILAAKSVASLFCFFTFTIMANLDGKSQAKKGRYRIYNRGSIYSFLDVCANSAEEALDIAANTDDSLFHEVVDDGNWGLDKVFELEDDDEFYPLDAF